MEIISYVKESKKRKIPVFFQTSKQKNTFSLPFNNLNSGRKNTRRQNPSVSYAYIYPSEKHVFKAGSVRNELSLRTVLAGIGRGVSNVADFCVSNIKPIVISLFAIIGIVAAAWGIGFAVNYSLSHTKAIAMDSQEFADTDFLDRLMASYVFENTSEVDENGMLLDSDASYVSLNLSQPVEYQTYTVKSGDTISGIAKKFGLKNISTLISVNDIGNVRQLGAGQKLKIPSIDGIIYTVKQGDTLSSIASANNIKMESLLDVNELSVETLTAGQQLFLPGVGLDQKTLQSRMGELFILPISASFRWSSPYGWRADPFTGVQSFHTGTDMACPEGTPILAAMSGKISDVGNNRTYGNYIIINHGNGYQTVYAHMSKTIAKKGQWVSQGTKIGLVGSTGYSTGPHLHFMVYKNGNRIDPMTVLKK